MSSNIYLIRLENFSNNLDCKNLKSKLGIEKNWIDLLQKLARILCNLIYSFWNEIADTSIKSENTKEVKTTIRINFGQFFTHWCNLNNSKL